jgi:outer membrane receptor protein involved in Fe transport
MGSHTVGTGFYIGEYHVIANDRSLVFLADAEGNQLSATPITVINNAHAVNILAGLYVDDLWEISQKLKLNVGLRWDDLTGFTKNNQADPTVNLSYLPGADTTLHAGYARYMQVPSFQGISPTASAAFAGTTAEGPPGISTPRTEDDSEFDVGVVHHFTPHFNVSEDNYYEITHRYLDTGQFGVVPIFAPFNYGHGFIWGSEFALTYKEGGLSAYGNVTIGKNLQKGVLTGQFNFPPDELAYIDGHHIVLDHQPMYGASAGVSYAWKRLTFDLDGIYSSGLRAGFADLVQLPQVIQFNAGVRLDLTIPGIGKVTDGVTVLNVLDRVNLIRPAEGIGIFQSAYGPRLTVLDMISMPF